MPALRGAEWVALQGGRTNRLWRVGRLVVKLYAQQAQSPLFPNDPLAEAKALRIAAPSGLAPTLRRTGPGWLAYDHCEGQTWQGGDTASVAVVLGKVHNVPCPDFRKVESGSAALRKQCIEIASQCRGTLPPLPPDPGVPATPPKFIHGDAVAGNILVTGQRLTLIDWQCPALGDPTEDLATFLSPAMQWLYRGQVLSVQQETAFLAAYPDPDITQRFQSMKSLFRWRMAAHCLWRAERGDADYAQAMTLELR